ncbi:MAG: hypothetical protein INR62_08470 [Rhodospirillales bacterium]|nr:hypothetical protein [Acetobacter sp.]
MLAVNVVGLTSQVAPCRFTLSERVAITSEAMRRGVNAEFLEIDDGEQLAAIGGGPQDEDGFAVGRDDLGQVTVASLRTGKAICKGNTVAWAMVAWRAMG